MNRPIARVLAWSMLALAASLPAHAQNFPDRPVHLIIPYGPGGIVDFARAITVMPTRNDTNLPNRYQLAVPVSAPLGYAPSDNFSPG